MKIFKWVFISAVVLIVVVIAIVFAMLNTAVRKGVEAGATDSLNLKTTLSSANVSLLGGTVDLSDLRISSPQGFESPQMFTLGGVKLGVSFGELRSDPVGIDQIVIDQPKLVIEQANGKFNIQVLTDQTSKQPPDSGKPGDGTRDESEPVRLVIHNLAVNNASVTLRPGIPGVQKEYVVNIPSLQMKDVGNSENNKNGAAIKQVVSDVIQALAKKASESDQLPPEVRQLLALNADQIKAQVKGEINKAVSKELDKVGKELEKKLPPEAARGAEDAFRRNVGGLLGGNQPATNPK